MTQTKQSRRGLLVISAYILAGCLVYFLLSWQVITEATGGITPNWTNPSAKSIKQVSPVTSSQSNPNLFDNLDCSLATYRVPTSSTMGTGCFTETALGLLESDSGIMIFNGTDEGLPLFSYSPHQVLVPWPRASALIALDTVSTGGSYISLYTSPVSLLKDQRNLSLQLTSKQLTAPPDVIIKDKVGQRLVINPQTMAFSDGGSWLVAETFNGSFVRINLSTLEIKPFAPSFTMSGSPALLKSRVAVSGDGQFVAIYNQIDGSFKVYDLTNCGAVTANLQPEACISYDYLPFIKGQIAGLQSIRHLRSVNENLLSFEAYTTDPKTAGIYALAPTASINSFIDYLGTGDSYASGEGAFDYLAGTDTAENMCHLSIRSYPILLTNDLFNARGGHSVACSGAVIKDVISANDRYKGQVKGVLDFKHLKDQDTAQLNSILTNFTPGYVAQHRFIGHYQPANITVEIGGNDIGFGNILEQCVGPHLSVRPSGNDCFSSYEDRLELIQQIDRTKNIWISALKQIKSAAPNAKVYAVGYPQIAVSNGSCALNVHLSNPEIELSVEIINYINLTIQESAAQAGVKYIDISQALVGHRMCETASYNVAVNGLTAGKDAGFFGINVLGKESYHPNALGHQLIELEILRKTHNFAQDLTDTIPAKSTFVILNAPKTGRKINSRQPINESVPKIFKKGAVTPFKLTGISYGLKPKSTYELRLDGPTGPVLSTTTSSVAGDITIDIALPGDTNPGSHTIDLIGDGQSDDTVDLSQPIFVPVSDGDLDGDVISDPSDTCQFAVNSGSDSDKDGLDDICDPVIGQPPTSTSPPSSPSGLPPGTQLQGGPLSGPPPQTTSSTTAPLVATITTTTANSLANAKITLQGNSKPNPTLSLINKPPASTKQRDATSAGHNTTSIRSSAQTHFGQAIGPSINWQAWVCMAVLLWLLIIAVATYLENFIDHRSPAV